ncbi:MAG TPA: hypothetical protein VGL62_06335, partial [Vicinamibacterales bacterium]
QSDGFYYYAYLRSLAFDHDVNFTNDYRLLGMGDKAQLFQPTPTGYAQSAWTIGPAIVWSPFFAVGHVVARALHARGREVSVDGTSFPYRQAVCLASLFYGLIGCWLTYRITRRFFPPASAAIATATVICGSFMLWYLVKEPSMTHAASMAAVALFVTVWLETRDARSIGAWAALGALTGLMALIRWQNVLFALLPGIDALLLLGQARARHDAAAARRAFAGSAAFLACAVIAFTPQMLAWKAIYGTFVARSPLGPQIRWTQPHVADVLWSARNGLLSSTPVLYLGMVGLILFALLRPSAGLPLLLAVAVMIYFNACIQDWWGSAAFGARRFDGTIPMFAIGLAAIVDTGAALLRRHATAAIAAALGVLVLWNLALIGAASEGLVQTGDTVPFDRAWSAQARVLHDWMGDPFTYPASLWFAVRNGVSPGEYDVLWTNRFLGDPARQYGRLDIGSDDDPFLEDGWQAPEHDGPITFRWAGAAAMLRIPLDHAAPLHIQIRLHAFSYPGAPGQTVTISANGRACAPVDVPADWATLDCDLDASAWRSGLNRVALNFGRAARPVDVGLGGDARPLAAAVDWIRVIVQR